MLWGRKKRELQAAIEAAGVREQAARTAAQVAERKMNRWVIAGVIVAIVGLVITAGTSLVPRWVADSITEPNVRERLHWNARADNWPLSVAFQSEVERSEYFAELAGGSTLDTEPTSVVALGGGTATYEISGSPDVSFHISSIRVEIESVEMPEYHSVFVPGDAGGGLPETGESDLFIVNVDPSTGELTNERGEDVSPGWNVNAGETFEIVVNVPTCGPGAWRYSVYFDYTRNGVEVSDPITRGPHTIISPAVESAVEAAVGVPYVPSEC